MEQTIDCRLALLITKGMKMAESKKLITKTDVSIKVSLISTIIVMIAGFATVTFIRVGFLKDLFTQVEANNIEIKASLIILLANTLVWSIYFRCLYKKAEKTVQILIDNNISCPGLLPTEKCVIKALIGALSSVVLYGVYIAVKWIKVNGVYLGLLTALIPAVIWAVVLVAYLCTLNRKPFIRKMNWITIVGMAFILIVSFGYMIIIHNFANIIIINNYTDDYINAREYVYYLNDYSSAGIGDEHTGERFLESIDVWDTDIKDHPRDYNLIELINNQKGSRFYIKMIPYNDGEGYVYDYKLTEPGEFGVNIVVSDWQYR